MMIKISATIAVFLAAWPKTALACAVCFGDPASPMTQGMNSGILVLLALSGVVLGAMGLFFFYLFKRSKMFMINGPEDLGISRVKEAGNLQ